MSVKGYLPLGTRRTGGVLTGQAELTATGDFEFSVAANSVGSSITIGYTAPDPADDPDWDRRLVIVRKQGEWPLAWNDSAAVTIVDDTFGASESSHTVEDSNLVPGQMNYYSMFRLQTNGAWAHDPQTNRVSAYPYDRWGLSDYFYESLPWGWRMADRDAGGDLESMVSIIGAILDNVKTDTENLLTLFDAETIHDDLIFLLDAKIAWPTWYATNGLQRRRETLEAVDLYKLMGRAAAYEQMLEEVSNWDASVVEGWRYVMFSNGLYGSTTPDLTPASVIEIHQKIGTVDDILKYTNDCDGWHSVTGLLFVLTEIAGVSGPLTEEMLDRYRELIEWGKASYVTTSLQTDFIVEELVLSATDEWTPLDDLWTDTHEDIVPFSYYTETDLGYTTNDYLMFTSNTLLSMTNTVSDRTFHSAIEYGTDVGEGGFGFFSWGLSSHGIC